MYFWTLAGKWNCPGFGGGTHLALSLGCFPPTVSGPGKRISAAHGFAVLKTYRSHHILLALANIITGGCAGCLVTNSLGSFLSRRQIPGSLVSFSTLWAYYSRELEDLFPVIRPAPGC